MSANTKHGFCISYFPYNIFIIPLLTFMISWMPFKVLAGPCYATSSNSDQLGSVSSAYAGTDSWDISSLFDTVNSVSENKQVTWNGYFHCPAVFWYFQGQVYYPNSSSMSYYTHFLSEEKGIDQWIKFSVTSSTSGTKNINPGASIVPLESYILPSYTITADLVESGPSSGSNVSTSYTGQVTIPTLAIAISSTNWSDVISAFNAETWPSSKWIATQKLQVTYNPPVTTCSVPNQTFKLPNISLNELSHETMGDVFSVSINCLGGKNNSSTRSVKIKLYSSDIVNSANYIIRNSNSTSNGIGFQLFNNENDIVKFSSSFDTNATVLWSMDKGQTLSTEGAFNLGARYKIYDQQNISSGTVIGTVTAYLEYN